MDAPWIPHGTNVQDPETGPLEANPPDESNERTAISCGQSQVLNARNTGLLPCVPPSTQWDVLANGDHWWHTTHPYCKDRTPRPWLQHWFCCKKKYHGKPWRLHVHCFVGTNKSIETLLLVQTISSKTKHLKINSSMSPCNVVWSLGFSQSRMLHPPSTPLIRSMRTGGLDTCLSTSATQRGTNWFDGWRLSVLAI